MMTNHDDLTRRSSARVPLEVPDTLFGKAAAWYSRRNYGAVLDSALAVLHNRRVAFAVAGFERRVEKWDALDPDLKMLAEVPRWRESDAFTGLERQVMEYAEAVTVTPPTVTDGLAEALRRQLGDAAFVELTMIVALENQRSRFNSALGLTSQGFKDRCGLDR